MIRPVPDKPVRLSASAATHLIAPVCGTCGREIDKTGSQWGHVWQLRQFYDQPLDDFEEHGPLEATGSDPVPDHIHAMMADDQAEILRLRETIAKVDRLCSRYERNRDPLLSVSEVRRALAEPERCGFTGTAAEHRAMGCCDV